MRGGKSGVEIGRKRAPGGLAAGRRGLLVLLGDEPCGGAELDGTEGGAGEERDHILLLLPHADEADAEHFEQLELFFPARGGLDDEPADAVAVETVGERLLAVLLGVDDFALERQLELAHLEVERAVGRQERGDRVAVFVEKAADGFVLRVVKREGAGGLGKAAQRGVGGAARRRSADRGFLERFGSQRGRFGRHGR